jgi:fatty-acyl-CoA synthase
MYKDTLPMGLITQLRHQFACWLMGRFQVPRDAVRWACKTHTDRVALVCAEGSYSFRALHERSLRLANALHDAGVGPDTVLLYQVHNDARLVEIRLAAYECGAIAVSLPDFATAAAVHAVLQQIRPHMVIASPDLPLATVPLHDGVRRILCGPLYEDWLRSFPPRLLDVAIDPQAVALLGMTSGTTGAPKLMATTHHAQVRSLQMLVGNADLSGPQAVGPCMPGIPLAGAGGGMLFPALLTGAALVLPPDLQTQSLVEWIERHQVTRLFVTPSQLIDLLELPAAQRARILCLRQIIYGTESMPAPKLAEALLEFGPILQQGYGSAEVLPPVALFSAPEHARVLASGQPERLASCGKVVSGVEVRIVDGTGAAMPTGGIGSVMVRSPTRFAGYWSAEGLRPADGGAWLAMGDLGYLDPQGYLFILGREADLLHTPHGGSLHPIYPRRVEDAAHQHPAVREAAAVQAGPGQPLWLVVTLRAAATQSDPLRNWAQDIRRFLEPRLPAAAMPGAIRVVRTLPRSPLAKLLRRQIRDDLLPAMADGLEPAPPLT